MITKKNAQGSIEFMLLVGTTLFFFTIFFLGVQESISDKLKEEKRIITQDIALQVKDEIDLAFKSSDGYYRKFDIPNKIKELDYEVSIIESLVYVKTDDNKHAVALPVSNITGQPIIGTNIIQKKGGIVYLNP